MRTRVNYEIISPFYNQRYNSSPLNGIKKHLEDIVVKLSPKKILEVGCGTGHWLSILSKYKSKFCGVDLSFGMLKQFNNPAGNTSLICCSADCLPFMKVSFDFIYCVNAIHQFNNPDCFIQNASSLLKNGGLLSIIGLDPFDKHTEWYMYDYFQSTREIDYKRFPHFLDLHGEMLKVGLVDIKLENVDSIFSVKNGNEVLGDHFLDKKGSSQLALLTDEEYFLGLQTIKNDIQKAESENLEINFTNKLFFYALTGKKKQ